jgi:hypothetical protein
MIKNNIITPAYNTLNNIYQYMNTYLTNSDIRCRAPNRKIP